jgi:hypothetical protein
MVKLRPHAEAMVSVTCNISGPTMQFRLKVIMSCLET